MKTIGFFGDSFCANDDPQSWCNILQKKLGATQIVNFGQPGRSVWSTFFTFNKFIDEERVPDISVFCWTEPYRLYHPERILTAYNELFEGPDSDVAGALNDYWKHLHNHDKDEIAYEYALRYYDQNILPGVNSDVVQTWSFRPFEATGKEPNIKLTTGTFIDESMFAFSGGHELAGTEEWQKRHLNHMTVEQNQQWADKIYDSICR